MGIGDWGLGIWDWGLVPIPHPQSPIPNPQSPIPKDFIIIIKVLINFSINFYFYSFHKNEYKIRKQQHFRPIFFEHEYPEFQTIHFFLYFLFVL